MSVVNHFRNKTESAQRNVGIIQILCRVYHQKRNFCSCVENIMHVLDPFFFRSSHGVARLFTYKVLVVIPGRTGFALKIILKC